MQNPWKGFLPRRAIVMTSAAAQHAAEAEVLEEAPSPPPPMNHGQSMDSSLSSADKLAKVAQILAGCTRCKLARLRHTIVVGEGNPEAELVFVGEGPGEQEDLQGRPFVGPAGQLLDRMIQAIGLRRDQVYILNVVKCRPPGNRNPEPDEIQACSPFLYQQLDALHPKIVVALGKFAAQTLLKTDTRISLLRGRFHPFRNAKLMPTWHPSYLLRNPPAKKEAWMDLQMAANELGLEIPKKSSAQTVRS